MARRGLAVSVAALLLALGVGTTPAAAADITFQATDQPDVVSGRDLWQYTYSVSGLAVVSNVAFEILFDPALYSDLQDPPPLPNPDWDILSLQPDPGLPDVGRYSALALVDGASLADSFTLTFAWLGGAGTTPGAQPFEIVEYDSDGNFVTMLATGQTLADQPAPVAWPGSLLLASAVFGIIALRKAVSRRPFTPVTRRGPS